MMSEKKDANKPVRCGDITSRILSALIEDQLVPAHLLTNSYSGNFSFISSCIVFHLLMPQVQIHFKMQVVTQVRVI